MTDSVPTHTRPHTKVACDTLRHTLRELQVDVTATGPLICCKCWCEGPPLCVLIHPGECLSPSQTRKSAAVCQLADTRSVSGC